MFIREDKLRGIVYDATSEDGLREDLFQVAGFTCGKRRRNGRDRRCPGICKARGLPSKPNWNEGAALTRTSAGMAVGFCRMSLAEQLLEGNDSVRSSACVRDLIEVLSQSLTPIERLVLWDFFAGMEVNEIARKEGITHQKVSTHRHTICGRAVRLRRLARVSPVSLCLRVI